MRRRRAPTGPTQPIPRETLDDVAAAWREQMRRELAEQTPPPRRT